MALAIGTLTLADIRDRSPCSSGWTKLLRGLGESAIPLRTVVSLGDVAKIAAFKKEGGQQ